MENLLTGCRAAAATAAAFMPGAGYMADVSKTLSFLRLRENCSHWLLYPFLHNTLIHCTQFESSDITTPVPNTIKHLVALASIYSFGTSMRKIIHL